MSSKVYANAACALDGVLFDGMTIMAELRCRDPCLRLTVARAIVSPASRRY
jgi:hypothetical protein